MKLSFSTYVIMAIGIAIGILSFGYFHQVAPTLTAVGYYKQYHEQLEQEANKMGAVKKRVAKAKADVQAKADAWNAYAATRTPENDVSRDGVSLAVNPYQLTVDTVKFRNSIQRAVNDQVKKGGIKVISVQEVRGLANTDESGAEVLSDYYNYPGIKFPVVLLDLGQVTVTGTYEQIMANVRSYKSMPHYLAVTDGLAITGTSPNLTGTYSLSIVGFIRGKEIFPASPTAAPATGAGGPGRGFPGGPGGPFGGPGGPGGPGGRGGGRAGAA